MDIKKICGYLHNGYLHEYRDEYEIDIYPVDRVRYRGTIISIRPYPS